MTTRQRRAVSPVIATVILIAVAVALGIAVAFWASGLTSSFSKYEKLGVNTQYAEGSGGSWVIFLGGQNTGSSDASITQIQVNGVPYPLSSTSILSSSSLTSSSSCPTSGSSPPYVYLASGPSGSLTADTNSLQLSVPSGANFAAQFVLESGSTTCGTGATFADGQTIQVTIITAAGNNYPASIVLP
jgi:flagellin-like protein